ncbi:MAG: carbon-nitrogen family hydrolase [Spirochaetales bacterium]|nr:carbon-nitrogen family hydrolase [Spirochaetales bacterium]
MKTACIQMDMLFEQPDENFEKASMLVAEAAGNGADVAVLPETWNIGFFPRENLAQLADRNGERTRTVFGKLAKDKGINIVAGSVACLKDDGIYNTCFVFNREGECIAEYDKTHLFTAMEEDLFFKKGDHTSMFELDGLKCGVIICYDIRFPELTRTMSVKGLDVLFVVSQWPLMRAGHLEALNKARAIENQMFVVCCNSVGTAGDTIFGGNSSVHDPWGTVLSHASDRQEEIIYADFDAGMLKGIRESINVFRDRRPELYEL